jgi:cytochrome c-type biogenesis protein CcmH/NrfF
MLTVSPHAAWRARAALLLGCARCRCGQGRAARSGRLRRSRRACCASPSELRCLVCQNQTIADSHADLAVDLREQVRVMLRRGDSDAQILQYMTDRYGDFVLYRPPVKAATWLSVVFGPWTC